MAAAFERFGCGWLYGQCRSDFGEGRFLERRAPRWSARRLRTRGNFVAHPAVAIRRELFLETGGFDTSLRFDPQQLDGAFVMPGFADGHTHFIGGGFQLGSVDLRDAATPEEFARRIGEFAASQPAGRWITGGDWDHELWGGELPQRAWIDSLTRDHPVAVQRLDGHMMLANSLALERAGITRETQDEFALMLAEQDGHGCSDPNRK